MGDGSTLESGRALSILSSLDIPARPLAVSAKWSCWDAEQRLELLKTRMVAHWDVWEGSLT